MLQMGIHLLSVVVAFRQIDMFGLLILRLGLMSPINLKCNQMEVLDLG